MPKSRRRKKLAPASGPVAVRPGRRKRGPSPVWVGGSILVLFIVGVVWLVVYYTTSGGIVGQRELGAWNILIGFGFICAGFATATQWR